MSITWARAAKLCGADTKALMDWPERLSFEQSAILAFGNSAADFEAAMREMRAAIEQGTLPAEDAERPREVRMLLREPDRFERLTAGSCKAVCAGDVLAWLAAEGVEPSEHIRAWGRAMERGTVAHQEDAAPKRETQANRVARCLTDCEDRAAAHAEPFDRKNMPGTKAEFLDLLHTLDAELRSIKTVDSLDHYLSKNGCKWPLNAGKQSSAASLYARLFPEARIRVPRAVSPQRRKA